MKTTPSIAPTKRESRRAQEAFTAYLELGSDRTLETVASIRRDDGTIRWPSRSVRRWSTDNNWVERAQEHDAEVMRQVKATLANDHARHVIDITRNTMEASCVIMHIGRKALELKDGTPRELVPHIVNGEVLNEDRLVDPKTFKIASEAIKTVASLYPLDSDRATHTTGGGNHLEQTINVQQAPVVIDEAAVLALFHVGADDEVLENARQQLAPPPDRDEDGVIEGEYYSDVL